MASANRGVSLSGSISYKSRKSCLKIPLGKGCTEECMDYESIGPRRAPDGTVLGISLRVTGLHALRGSYASIGCWVC